MTWRRLFQTRQPHRWAAMLGRGAEVALTDDTWWLRMDADADWSAATGPVGWIDDRGRRAARPGSVVTDRLTADWCPLDDVLQLQLPTASVVGPVRWEARTAVRWVRDPRPPELNLKVAGLFVDLTLLIRWIDLQPAAALAAIQWAVDGGQALLIGPAPSIAGTLLIDREGILVQAGWTALPRVTGTRIRSLCGAGQGDVVVWTAGDGLQVIPADVLQPLRRGAVRLAAETLRCSA